MEMSHKFEPFKLFWINCMFSALFSILTSIDSSYNLAAMVNDYSYTIEEMQTPNDTKYNSLVMKPIVKYGRKFTDMLFTESTAINFEYGDNYFNIIKALMEENKLIMVGVDLFYWIPYSVCWNKHHWEHYSFINGFDDEKRMIYVFDDSFNGYDEFEVPEDRLIKAIENFPHKPSAYIYEISRKIKKFDLSISEIKDNSQRIIDEINKTLMRVNYWELDEKDFLEGHMCDLISMQIFQIVNRHIANQLLIQELKDEICNPHIINTLIKFCTDLQKGWTLIKNKFIKIYFSKYKKSLIDEINEKCKSLFLKELTMWEIFLSSL